jgi:hypothetical protein
MADANGESSFTQRTKSGFGLVGSTPEGLITPTIINTTNIGMPAEDAYCSDGDRLPTKNPMDAPAVVNREKIEERRFQDICKPVHFFRTVVKTIEKPASKGISANTLASRYSAAVY